LPSKLYRVGTSAYWFQVYNPDFEASNFSNDELADVANQMARGRWFAADITSKEIEQEKTMNSQPVGR